MTILKKSLGKWLALIVVLAFVMPMLLARYLYRHPSMLSKHRTNHGQLINPPAQLSRLQLKTSNGQPFADKELHGKWLLMYVTNRCDELCTKNLYNMRQVSIATGKNQDRVMRVLLTTQPLSAESSKLLQNHYKGTLHLLTSHFYLQQIASHLQHKNMPKTLASLYIVDPLGNIMMQYSPTGDPNGLLKDLSKLLKISQIG